MFRLGLAIIFILQLTSGADAAKRKLTDDQLGPPMRFVIVRSSTPGCEPLCTEWISAEGAIVSGSPSALKAILKKAGSRRLPIIVTSPGGRVEAAEAMGRIIRKRKLDIAVGATSFTDCAPEEKDCKLDPARKGVYAGAAYESSYCASACPLMLAGGVRRLVGSWANLGVHQVTTVITKEKLTYKEQYRIVNGKKRVVGKKIVGRKTTGSYTTTEMGKAQRRRMLAYLKEMGIKQTLLDVAQSVPASDMRWLRSAEMLDMNLITSLDAANDLTRADLCKQEPPAENCIYRPLGEVEQATPAAPDRIAPVKLKTASMRFILVRSGEAGCEPTCPEWISAEGAIDAKTPALFETTLKSLGGRKLPLVLSSPGGNIDAAMALGRSIRKSGIDVAVGITAFLGCRPGGKDCESGPGKRGLSLGSAASVLSRCTHDCVLMLAGGIQRLAGYGAIVGWTEPAVEDKALEAKLEAYLKEMGVHRRALNEDSAAALDERGQWQLHKVRLLTSTSAVNFVVGGDICKNATRPDNCRTVAELGR
jgi:hypothetical protein